MNENRFSCKVLLEILRLSIKQSGCEVQVAKLRERCKGE